MRIVRFHEFGGPEVLKFEEVATPDPKDGEVLIRTEAIGVNFTDIARRKNSATLRERLALPYTPGVEAVGTVVGTGAGSAPVSIGTKVIAIVQDGAYSEYLTVPAARAIPGPDPGLDSAQAVALPVQGLTAYLVLATFGRLQPGERVLIQAAAGGVGSMAVQLAKILGAGQVIAAAGTSAKLDLARSLGADAGVNYGESGWIEQVLKVTGGKGVDLALDMLGGSRFSETFAYLAPFGRIVTYGAATGERAATDPEKLTSRCHSVIGFYSGHVVGTHPELVFPALTKLFQLATTGSLRPQVHHRFPLEAASEAHRLMETRRTTGKVVLFPAGGQ